MSNIKSLCAKIPLELHTKVRDSQVESGLTLNQYIEQILTEYYERGKISMSDKTKTLAIQISEEMSIKIKAHIAKTPKLTLKSFLIGLIEQALANDTANSDVGTDNTEETS